MHSFRVRNKRHSRQVSGTSPENIKSEEPMGALTEVLFGS